MKNKIDKELNEKVMSGVAGEFEVIGEPTINIHDNIILSANFMFHGRNGSFKYTLEGGERGIDEVEGFQEEGEEDIYGEIHDWMDEHITWTTKVFMDDKELK